MISAPITVTGDGQLMLFDSAALLKSYLEWPDVEDGLYSAFDANARPLALRLIPRREKLLWIFPVTEYEIVVEQPENEPSRDDELRRVLIDALQSVGIEGLNELATPRLLELARPYFGT